VVAASAGEDPEEVEHFGRSLELLHFVLLLGLHLNDYAAAAADDVDEDPPAAFLSGARRITVLAPIGVADPVLAANEAGLGDARIRWQVMAFRAAEAATLGVGPPAHGTTASF
jgi:hypothetical protein